MPDNQISKKLTIEVEADEVTVYAVISSDADEIEYSEEWLEKQLVLQGCTGLSVTNSAHEKMAELFEKNRSGRVKLGQKIDAKVEVLVAGDHLSASLRITAAKGGQPVSSQDVVNALNDNELELERVNKNRIVGLVKKSRLIVPGEAVEVMIAKGRPPEHGKDTRFECLLDDITDRKPSVRSDGSLDYYDLGEIVSVEEGCQLMRKLPPTPTVIGRSVTGEEIPARIGKKINFKKCKGAVVSPKDSDVLVSAIKGQPVIGENGITIEKVYTVSKVDLRTGHIDFDGTVIVKGDVASGMSIKVTGDVQIFGIVENACIESGGNVDIKLGMIGRSDNSKEESCQINCKGNLTAGYLENVYVRVEGDIFIKSRISNCNITGNNQIIVGNPREEKSGIVGGNVSAGSIIRAEVLGSSGGALTHVAIACSDGILEQYESLKTEIVVQDELLVRMLGLMVGLSKKRSPEAKELLQNTRIQTDELKALINGLITQKDEIEAYIEKVRQGKIIVQKEAFPGVAITILDQQQKIKGRYGQGTFLLFDGSMSHNSSVN